MSPWRAERPEDFRVDEIPLYEASGEGEHTFVHVEKRLRTTEEVARGLARAAGVRAADVGYAGRKDRHAITTQWLSVPGLDPAHALALQLPGVRVLGAVRHPHKLRTGQLRGNAFRVVVRGVPDGAFARAQERLEALVRNGLPNRFGAQRFGRRGDNAEAAGALLRGEARLRDRREARFLLSALQARVFNEVLAARPGPLGELERGDVAVVHASGGLFTVEAPEPEQERARRFEISPTGPLFGRRAHAPAGAVAERERAVLASCGVPDPLPALRGIRLRGGRRALRVQPRHADLERSGDDAVLAFELPSGSYATVLLEEVFAADA